MQTKSEKIKQELVWYAKMLEEKGFVNTAEGNISIFDREDGLMYITPSNTRKSLLNEDMVAVMKGNEQIGGSRKRSGEFLLHEEALKSRPDCNAVVHVHTPYLTAYAFCGKSIKIKCSTTFALLIDEIPCLPYGEPGTVHIADGIEDAIKNHDLIILANHGVVSVGKTLEDAIKIIEAAEETLKIYSLAKTIGPVSDITDEQLKSMHENHPLSVKKRIKH